MIYYLCDGCKMLQLHYNHYTPPKLVTQIMIRSQEEERGKVIDDVLVILQTLLKRTDSLQSLVCMLHW